MSDNWDISSGATKLGGEDLDTWFGPVVGWIEDKCKTGLNSQMKYIDDEGKGKSFTKQSVKDENGRTQVSYFYQLKEVEENNRFRIYVETLSGPDGGDEDDDVTAQKDRVSVVMRQLNTPYLTNLALQILSSATPDEARVFLDSPEKLTEALFAHPDFDPNLVYGVVWSRTLMTDKEGNSVIDVDIPDTWSRGLVYVQILYGYDADSERENIDKIAEFQSELFLEFLALVVGIVIMLIPGVNVLVGSAYWAIVGGLFIAEVAFFTYLSLAGMSPAGNNMYDCSFPAVALQESAGSSDSSTGDEVSLGFLHPYVIQLGDEVAPESEPVNAEWLTILEENAKVKKKNAMIILGAVGFTFIASLVVASSLGGDES